MSVQNILARNIAPPGPLEYFQINFKRAISNVRKEQESPKGVSNWAATERFLMRGGLGEGGSHNLVARPPTAFSTQFSAQDKVRSR